MERIGYYTFRFTIFLFSLIPFWLLYRLSDAMCFLFFRVIKYRYQVIEKNLRNSFPEKSDSEIKRLIKGAYRNLCDVTLESIKGMSTDNREVVRRCIVTNKELLDPYFERKQNLVLAASHYGNYEWGTRIGMQFDHFVLGVFKPLRNKLTNQYVIDSRTLDNMDLIPLKETYKAISRYDDRTIGVALIADQSPSNLKSAIWTSFLNQDTAFLPGPEGVGRGFDMPVIYMDVQRIRRGYYTIELSVLCDNPQELVEGEIIELYKNKLEEIIKKKPEDWLWSHKRWKHKREKVSEITA